MHVYKCYFYPVIGYNFERKIKLKKQAQTEMTLIRITQKTLLLVILFLLSYSIRAQTSSDSLEKKSIAKEKVIRIAKSRGFYKTAGAWKAGAYFNAKNNTWEVKSLKNRHWWPLKHLQPFKGDEKVKSRYIVIDAASGKILERKRKKTYITYFN